MRLIAKESLKYDGRTFNFKESALVRKSKQFNNKRDMRKKFIKSDRPTYTSIKKGQEGLKFVSYEEIPKYNVNPSTFSTFNIPIINDNIPVKKIEEQPVEEQPVEQPQKIATSPKEKSFDEYYDEVEREDPSAKNYRQFLTKMAKEESGFNSKIRNKAGAPAYGYFQFMQDGKRYNNISAYAGTDIETFKNNPKLQIQAALKLAKSFENGFTRDDLAKAQAKGFTKFGLLGGAWLAGNSGVRKYLQNKGNPSDRHWGGTGTDVANRIKLFNF